MTFLLCYKLLSTLNIHVCVKEFPISENIYVFEIIVWAAITLFCSYLGIYLVNRASGTEQIVYLIIFMFVVLKLIEKTIDRFHAWKRREFTKESIEFYQFHKIRAEIDNLRLDKEIKEEQLKVLKRQQ